MDAARRVGVPGCFHPGFFQHFERRILDLQKLGIEADIILLHPYDKGAWGFDRMTATEDDRYLRYVVARLAALRNIWWSLANEYDFMEHKTEEDWERIGQLVSRTDPFHHLLGIHNGMRFFNQTRPWVTHASIQNGSAVEDAGRAVLYRQNGQPEAALSELGQARKIIENGFDAGLKQGGGDRGLWFDWVFARVLLREASELLPAQRGSAQTEAR
jgi:hypothetical protein